MIFFLDFFLNNFNNSDPELTDLNLTLRKLSINGIDRKPDLLESYS